MSQPNEPVPVRSWCCRRPIDGPHTPGCAFEPRPDNGPDYAELLKPQPGALWQLPDFTWRPEPVTAEIPIPAELEAVAQWWDEIGLFGVGLGDVIRDCWPAVSAEIMRARRVLIATAGAADEAEYFGGIP